MIGTKTEIPPEFINELGEIIYPDSDGLPMADNAKQFAWISKIKWNLEVVFADNPNVFVAGDLLWYAVEGQPQIRTAPDTMVVFGRPKGHRGSYQQWKEDNIAPQVVFEVLSPENTAREMLRKLNFYNLYKVCEYYVYDPDSNEFLIYVRNGKGLNNIYFSGDYKSHLLGIRFLLTDETLLIYSPQGKPFIGFVELNQSNEEALKKVAEERKAKEAAIKEEKKAIEEKEQALAELAKLKEILKKSGNK